MYWNTDFIVLYCIVLYQMERQYMNMFSNSPIIKARKNVFEVNEDSWRVL